jgi:hypothetical protein
VIYCVVPEVLAPELFAKLSSYYVDDPNVEVIIDRRHAERRTLEGEADTTHKREIRDRRRHRVTGEFPPLDPA